MSSKDRAKFYLFLVAEDYKDTQGAEQISQLISERIAEVCRNRNIQKAKDFDFYSVYITHSNGIYWNKKDTNFVFQRVIIFIRLFYLYTNPNH